MASDKPTELCKIAFKYGTDKTPLIKHGYTPFYYDLFKERKNEVKKVVELGIGHFKGMQKVRMTFDKGLSRFLHRGASLYMWRDFFPNAQIYGADIRPETMFTDERIETILCDETKENDLKNLIKKTGSDIDIFIDDGSHKVDHQVFAAQTLMPLLDKNVTYIIEDVSYCHRIPKLLHEYECFVPKIPKTWPGGWLVVVRHKHHD